MSTTTRTTVLFIGGEGRSGSTVLERLIASNQGMCAVGELKNLFERGVGNRELCGCGEPVLTCELWSEVGRRLAGGWETPEGRELVDFFHRVNRRRDLPTVLAGRGTVVARARSILATLYPMIAEITGAEVIVDSSKHPGWAYLLAGTDGIDLRVVHLVRHPSGVVQSWSKPVVRPQAGEGRSDRFMPAHSPLEVSVRWDAFNVLFDRLAARSFPTLLVRYEDYVQDVDGALRACVGLTDLEYSGRPTVMSSGHGIAGNPSRFAADEVAIAGDERWVSQMSEAKHAVVSALTWPVRRRYRYFHSRTAPVGPLPARTTVPSFVPAERSP
jgi:hypothetical protein